VTVSGSKNASFPILAASLLTGEPCQVRNLPRLRDMEVMLALLESLGSTVEDRRGGCWQLDSSSAGGRKIPDGDLIRKIRGSVYLMGALLAAQGYAEMPFPGGCAFGSRPIDLHLRGFEGLGAQVERREDRVVLTAPRGLRGTTLFLGGPAGGSVTGTADVLLAAVKARGHTRLEYAACEPEVVELCRLLVAMGAKIEGIGSPVLKIEGVDQLGGFSHAIAPDRIEAGTWVLLGLGAGHPSRPVTVASFPAEELGALLFALREMGAGWQCQEDCLEICGGQELRGIEVHTLPYPGFPTDLQAPLAALLCSARSGSSIHDHIYPQRFSYADGLRRLGARCEGLTGGLRVQPGALRGAAVEAGDLRAAAALYLAGLMAEGRTQIAHAEYAARGYECFGEKLRSLGARIEERPVGA